MRASIRTRLLLGVTGGMAVLVVVFAVVAYEVASRSLIHSFDAVLASTVRMLAAAVEQNDHEVKADFAETDLSGFRRASEPDYFQIWLDDGSMLAASHQSGSTGTGPFSGSPGETIARATALPDGRPGRAVGLRFVPTIDDEGPVPAVPRSATMVVARGTAELDAQVGRLRWLLAIGAAATVLLSLGVGAIVVGQGLRPLDRLARRIAAIRHDNLAAPVTDERMPRELRPLVDRLNGLLTRLQEAFQRERTFTADAAHELRTPLAGLRSTIEVSLSQPRDAGQYREALAACLEIVLHAQALVDTLIELSRLESRHGPESRGQIRLADVVEAAWRPLEQRAGARRLVVRREIAQDLVCTTDRATLRIALGAAFTNAVDYADEGGRIDIVAGRSDGTVWLDTSNTGCTLTADDARHVFERFWRGDAARSGTGAHYGLGLALAERAVAIGGGTLSAEVSGHVFTLRLRLPVGPDAL